VARRDAVVGVAHALLETAKLDEPVAHHVGVRRQPALQAIHNVAHHLVPILLLQVEHLNFAAIFARHGRRHLPIFLGRAAPFVFVARTNFYVEQIGRNASLAQQSHGHCAVDTT